MESFYGRFKTSTEAATLPTSANCDQSSNTFYNRYRKHSSLSLSRKMGGQRENKTLYQNKPPDTLINKQ